MYDLERFISAQDTDYNMALQELNDGRKVSHWIWYIFPQLEALGYSDRAKYFGIEGIEEARAYMNHPFLGPRYLTCVEALLQHDEQPPEIIMGSNVDAKKLRSSLTLMTAAGGGATVRKAIDIFFEGHACPDTIVSLAQA